MKEEGGGKWWRKTEDGRGKSREKGQEGRKMKREEGKGEKCRKGGNRNRRW